jgi:hypothetical protein
VNILEGLIKLTMNKKLSDYNKINYDELLFQIKQIFYNFTKLLPKTQYKIVGSFAKKPKYITDIDIELELKNNNRNEIINWIKKIIQTNNMTFTFVRYGIDSRFQLPSLGVVKNNQTIIGYDKNNLEQNINSLYQNELISYRDYQFIKNHLDESLENHFLIKRKLKQYARIKWNKTEILNGQKDLKGGRKMSFLYDMNHHVIIHYLLPYHKIYIPIDSGIKLQTINNNNNNNNNNNIREDIFDAYYHQEYYYVLRALGKIWQKLGEREKANDVYQFTDRKMAIYKQISIRIYYIDIIKEYISEIAAEKAINDIKLDIRQLTTYSINEGLDKFNDYFHQLCYNLMINNYEQLIKYYPEYEKYLPIIN